MIRVFKLMDKNSGLFSTGGCYGRFNHQGKTWSSLANLKSHLRMKYYGWDRDIGKRVLKIPDNLVVVEAEFNPDPNLPYKCLAKDLF